MQQGYRSEAALGYQQITNLSTAQALTIPSGCALVLVSCETQSVRWRDDGVNPTASVGYPLPKDVAELQYTAQAAAALRFIEQTAGAKLNVLYYGA